MLAVFYIGKRTLFDILRTGVFWIALGLTAALCFIILFWGWHQVELEQRSYGHGTYTDMGPHGSMGYQEDNWNPLTKIEPETWISYYVYGVTIMFANLLSIFIMMGLIGREIDRRTVELLLARPVSRGQIYLGKLLAGWMSLVLFMVVTLLWTMFCQVIGGMGLQPDYIKAWGVGVLSPIIIGAMTYVMTIWMKGFLAGLIGTVVMIGSGTVGNLVIKLLGKEVLKLDLGVYVLYRILPPLNVIGQKAVEHIQTDAWFNFAKAFFEGMLPAAEDGIYTEMWQVWAYLGVVVLVGWLSFFRRQFS